MAPPPHRRRRRRGREPEQAVPPAAAVAPRPPGHPGEAAGEDGQLRGGGGADKEEGIEGGESVAVGEPLELLLAVLVWAVLKDTETRQRLKLFLAREKQRGKRRRAYGDGGEGFVGGVEEGVEETGVEAVHVVVG